MYHFFLNEREKREETNQLEADPLKIETFNFSAGTGQTLEYFEALIASGWKRKATEAGDLARPLTPCSHGSAHIDHPHHIYQHYPHSEVCLTAHLSKCHKTQSINADPAYVKNRQAVYYAHLLNKTKPKLMLTFKNTLVLAITNKMVENKFYLLKKYYPNPDFPGLF